MQRDVTDVQPELNSAMMNALSNNPELFRTMMQSNPMMTRLMETNPQLAQALNNPEVLRDAARAMSSPVRPIIQTSVTNVLFP